ncbi:mannosyltransferase [Microbotryomycetes sp. JL221]|nr:mannosyltransferase [Microbotryomycetes sp. JL221]
MSAAGINVPAAQQLRFRQNNKSKHDGSVLRAGTINGTVNKGTGSASSSALVRPLIADASRLPGWSPSLVLAARILIVARWYSAMCSIITDCDEVYNYWEPLHYLWRGVGFQTWEYSPVYAIRSYFYLLVNASPLVIAQHFASKRVAFFAVRLTFATISTVVESHLYRSAAEHINPHVGRYMLFALLFAPGMFSAATAFLPSTFALWGVMLATSYALRPADGSRQRIIRMTTAFGVAALVGWPFVAILAGPSILEHIFFSETAPTSPTFGSRFASLLLAGLPSVGVLLTSTVVDSKAYQRWVIVPWNIIKYNVFPESGSGSTLYGTEPSSFYFINASLQFNVLFPLALLSLPAIWLTTIVDPKRFGDARYRRPGSRNPALALAIRLVPMHLWLAVLSLHAHKEERFLYPIYGHIVLNAATTLYLARCWVQQAFLKITKSPFRTGRTPVFAYLTTSVMVLFAVLSVCRIAALFNYYHSPLDIFAQLEGYELPRLALQKYPSLYPAAARIDASQDLESFVRALDKAEQVIELDSLEGLGLRLCLGKEWHRFPSHFLVPDAVEVRFVQSGFEGILPKVWDNGNGANNFGNSSNNGRGLFGRATHVTPAGMNSVNKQEMDRFVNASSCHYLVDFASATDSSTHPLEPCYASQANWERVLCLPFLDKDQSWPLTRAFYLPVQAWQKHNSFGNYCLLRNKDLL